MALRVFGSTAASRLGISLLPRTFATVIGDLKYSDSHEWVKVEGNSATVGITDHAQGHLGDVVSLQLPREGTCVGQGYVFAALESFKATSHINSPISGQVLQVNQHVLNSLALINTDPYGQGWMIKVQITDPDELNNLMDSEKYSKFCDEEDAANH